MTHRPHQVAVIVARELRPASAQIVGMTRNGEMVILETSMGHICLMPVEFCNRADIEYMQRIVAGIRD